MKDDRCSRKYIASRYHIDATNPPTMLQKHPKRDNKNKRHQKKACKANTQVTQTIKTQREWTYLNQFYRIVHLETK